MNSFDYAVIVILIVGAVFGYRRGAVREIFGLIAFVLAIFAGFKLTAVAGIYISKLIKISDTILPFVSFAVVFVLIIILVLLLSKAIEGFLKSIKLNLPNRLLGALLGMAKFAFLLSVLVVLADKAGAFPPAVKNSSRIFPFLLKFAPWVYDYTIGLIPFVRNVFDDIGRFFDEVKRNLPK